MSSLFQFLIQTILQISPHDKHPCIGSLFPSTGLTAYLHSLDVRHVWRTPQKNKRRNSALIERIKYYQQVCLFWRLVNSKSVLPITLPTVALIWVF